MDLEAILLGAAVPIILGLMGLVGLMWRGQNNKANNPGSNAHLARIEMLLEQQVEQQRDNGKKLDDVLLSLTDMKATIRFCPTVQDRMRGG